MDIGNGGARARFHDSGKRSCLAARLAGANRQLVEWLGIEKRCEPEVKE